MKGVFKKMIGSSFPVWVIVLLVGVVGNFVMGCLNPFVVVDGNKKVREIRKNESNNSDGLSVEIRYHFGPSVYFSLSLILGLIAEIFFFIESFSAFRAACFADSVWGMILAILSAIILFGVVKVVLILIGLSTESKQTSAMHSSYARKGIDVVNE